MPGMCHKKADSLKWDTPIVRHNGILQNSVLSALVWLTKH